ncbi:hypothetical protein [Evansella cellulosilytica]|uniref:Uncharacterized protein n=1 Tax=Evansella cellulosilytica (strain ATCC 21833 / DSM 2522 / FERM P-1141 / JCM 9156 / N-4) TaxID=649639 RepID=E6TRH6_EVAC2|nr:hypothetical protein [Evansella cellulosilytica]ADU31806.1 hypothetical protein Bcell_3565 [Evansella cellulosilytica DSM 2522]
MSINVSLANSQANRVRDYASTMKAIRSSLSGVRGSLNNGWNAREMSFINYAIDDLRGEMNSVNNRLQAISSDIVTTAYEIKREEEEAKRAAERAAAERAAAERAAAERARLAR